MNVEKYVQACNELEEFFSDSPSPTVLEEDEVLPNAFDVQIGGDHYKKLAIQPMLYSFRNKLDPCQHTAIKYITRFREKEGIKDLEKAKHCIDMLIELEYGNR